MSKGILQGHLFLTGFMGSGKSTVGRMLARDTGYVLYDMDSEIERTTGRSISDIFEQDGESYFRSLETRMLTEMKGLMPLVVSTGGGVIVTPINISIMKEQGRILYLKTDPETCIDRIIHSKARPLVSQSKNREELLARFEGRRGVYESSADIIIDTDGLSAKEVTDRILNVI